MRRELKEKVDNISIRNENNNKGIFWITYDKFISYFSAVSFCLTNLNLFEKVMTNSFYDPRFSNKMRIYRLKVEFNTRFFFKLFHLIDNSAIKIDLGLCLLKKIETGAASKNYEDNVSDGDDLIDMDEKISMAEMDDVDDIDDMIDYDEKFEYYNKYRSKHKKFLNINDLELESGTYILIPYSSNIWKSNKKQEYKYNLVIQSTKSLSEKIKKGSFNSEEIDELTHYLT